MAFPTDLLLRIVEPISDISALKRVQRHATKNDISYYVHLLKLVLTAVYSVFV